VQIRGVNVGSMIPPESFHPRDIAVNVAVIQ